MFTSRARSLRPIFRKRAEPLQFFGVKTSATRVAEEKTASKSVAAPSSGIDALQGISLHAAPQTKRVSIDGGYSIFTSSCDSRS